MATPSTDSNLTDAGRALPIKMWEFVAMMAAIFGMQAMAIDVMLPALETVGTHYSRSNPNDQQLVIFAFVLGFGLPQLVFGPIADRYGRKVLLITSLFGYVILSFLCMVAPSFEMLLLARLLQGVCCAGTRVSAGAIIRDVSAGRTMAKVLSLVFTVFMIVPILAPAIGTLIMVSLGWNWTFGILGVYGVVMLIWTGLRLPATQRVEDRRPMSLTGITNSFARIFQNRTSFGYMAASGVVFGALFAFIGASEQIFDEAFGRGDKFWLWFAGIAGLLAVMNFSNSRVVEAWGMRRISHVVMIAFLVLSIINFLWMSFVGPDFWVFYILFALAFGCFGMMGANFASLALEPMGDIAGTANAVYGFATSTLSSLLGLYVARQFDGTVKPILLGFVGLGLASFIIILITERGKLFEVGTGKAK